MLVTVKKWYMKKRVYGRVVGSNKHYVFVQGKFGLEQFHRSSVRVVRANKACSGFAAGRVKNKGSAKAANR
jgi:hypothetical protein